MADDIPTCGDLDERLTPYVDGEDTPAAHRAVDAHLGACPPCRDAAREESDARTLMRAHRAALCASAPEALRARCQASALADAAANPASAAPPASRLPVLPSPRRRVLASSLLRRWVPLSLAATLVLAVAGVFVFGLNDRVEALAASLAVDHVKCFKVNGTATEADARVSEHAWQQDQGWPIAIPQTASAEQLKLVCVRRCFSTDGRAAHLMYTWRGEPLSLYVLQGQAGGDRFVHTMGAQAVVWSANHRIYAVVSSDTTRDLAPIVDYLKARVQ